MSRRAFALNTTTRSAKQVEPEKIDAARGLFELASALAGTRGADYLTGRGIPEQVAEAAGARYHQSFYGRPAVVFPIRDRSGGLVAMNGRYIDGRNDPKARAAGRKSLGVFATSGAFDAEYIAICEAPIDALTLAACGIPSIALCGTSGPAWLPSACAFRRVALAFDADAAGDAAADGQKPVLKSLGARVERWRPVGAKDWNQLLVEQGVEAVRSSLKHAE